MSCDSGWIGLFDVRFDEVGILGDGGGGGDDDEDGIFFFRFFVVSICVLKYFFMVKIIKILICSFSYWFIFYGRVMVFDLKYERSIRVFFVIFFWNRSVLDV